MHPELWAALRQRLSVRTGLLWLGSLAVVYYVTRNPALIAGIATAYCFVGATDLLADLPGVDERWVKAGFAVSLGAASTAWLWYTLVVAGGQAWLPLAAVVVSVWLILDVRADFVQNRRLDTADEFEDMTSAEAMLTMQHAHLVVQTLQDEPMTVPELATACDLTPSRVEDVIDIASEEGTIYPVDPDADEVRYAVDERQLGASGLGRQAVGGVSGLLARLVRPFTDQF
jgi:hypothetical protein